MREFEPRKQIPKEEKQDWDKRQGEGGYSDKGGHRARSEANQPQHKEHWKKVERGRNE